MPSRVDPNAKGRTATIIAVAHPDYHALYVGRVGTVVKVVKSRNVYLVEGEWGRFESFPSNVRVDTLATAD